MTIKAKMFFSMLTLFILLVGAVGVIVLVSYDDLFDSGDQGILDIDPNAGEYVSPNTGESGAQGISIPGWETITIAANTKNVLVDFPNPIANKDKYYLTFQLKVGDEILYQSQLVPPGMHIQSINLSKALSAGTYEAVIHVQPYKMNEEKTPTNNSNVKVTLIVV